MRLLIDNSDGKGLIEYTQALVASEPLKIVRARDALARCSGLLDVNGTGLAQPAMGGRVQVKSDAGISLFAGYIIRVPLVTNVVISCGDEVKLLRFEAAEDAWLLNVTRTTSLQPEGSSTHAVSMEENEVKLTKGNASELAMLVGDVTVSGAREATTYVTELFAGDGSSTSFPLMEAPFRESGSATLIEDSFDTAQFDAQRWTLTDTGQHLGFGSGGLQVSGGNGFDGQTTLQAAALVEMGGTLTAELSDVSLQQGSDGVLLGMYAGAVSRANCFAGFRVKGDAGARTIVALVNGGEVGSAFTFVEGHRYTLRLRLHCAETQRVLESYEALVNGTVQRFGGGFVEAPMQLTFEIQDLGLASSTVATVLYAGAIASSPVRCIFGAVNSIDLLMEAGKCTLTRGGSAWVISTMTDGTVVPRREGVVDASADFSLTGSTLLFFPGRVPVPEERIQVTYRRGERSVAHLQDADASAVVSAKGLPGLAMWEGEVTDPTPRSSADCRAAAMALLAFGKGLSTGIGGTCTIVNAQGEADVIPGDLLSLPNPAGDTNLQIPIETVTIQDGHSSPEVLTYEVTFAQQRSNGLSFQNHAGLPDDVPRPVSGNAGSTLENLPDVQVVSATEAALQIDAGVAPPNGGGFEVRRRDGGFGKEDADLVLQSPVRSFSLPRTAYRERFYVRMYDGSSPAVYSGRSSVVITHLAVE